MQRFTEPGAVVVALLGVLVASSGHCRAVEVGFGKADITPDAGGPKPVWIAGYGHNRRATGVHDPLYARAVVVRDGPTKVALVSVDLVGFMYPSTKNVRAKLEGFTYVLVSSTHNHEGPDTIGLWGPSIRESGVDPDYLKKAEAGVVEAVRSADASAVPARAEYGTAEDETLVRDSRLPIAKDGVIRVLRFVRNDDGQTDGLLVQWNCHPETLGGKNTLITADFPASVIAALEKRYSAPVAYFSGAVGGLMTGPRDRIKTEQGEPLAEGQYEYAERYGAAVSELAAKALKGAEAVNLSPIAVAAKPLGIPLANLGYRVGRELGVLKREAFEWTGDPMRLGNRLPEHLATGHIAMETEVGYLRLGQVHVAAIPGELYPELVYGHFQDPADPNADFPTAPLEPAVLKTLPGSKALILGLANDEVGYIIPKRQWDDRPPFAYGRTTKQYGEINSVGPETAPILMQALVERVREAGETVSGAGRP
ncbi:MAG TPA: neutral/alkaline non-lysosomal ceramidase N-terminal domain-containing protein [Isosphaeraceae bacterium]|nr:neutral/alkaline non-lysosomal ceramidase N-terminal domain-containing protein [Isosphaeraceae bacterium]